MSDIEFKNTKDWSKDLQPYIDNIFSSDGDPASLSQKDVDFAKQNYCQGILPNGLINTIFCAEKIDLNNEKDREKLFFQLQESRSLFTNENPLNEYLTHLYTFSGIDQKMIDDFDVFMHSLLLTVKNHFVEYPDLKPGEITDFVSNTLRDKYGLSIVQFDVSDPVHGIQSRLLDCDTSALVYGALAFEFNWPITFQGQYYHVSMEWEGVEIYPSNEVWPGVEIPYKAIAFLTMHQVLELSDSDLAMRQIYANEVVEHAPNWFLAYDILGSEYLGSGNAEEAERCFKKAIELCPHDPNALVGLAQVKFNSNEFEEALKFINTAIKYDAETSYFYIRRSLIYAKLGKPEEAKNDLRIISELKGKKDLSKLLEKSEASLDAGDVETALHIVNEAIESYPRAVEAYRLRARIYNYILGKERNAISDLSMVIELDPNDIEAHKSREYMFSLLGEYEMALKDLDFVLSKDPNNMLMIQERARCFVGLKRFEEAKLIYESLIKLRPELEYAWQYEIGRVLYEEGKLKEAIRRFKLSYKVSVDSGYMPYGEVLVRIAGCYLELGDKATALKYAKEALTANIKKGYSGESLAEILWELGEDKLALEAINLSISSCYFDCFYLYDWRSRYFYTKEDYFDAALGLFIGIVSTTPRTSSDYLDRAYAYRHMAKSLFYGVKSLLFKEDR